MLKVDAVTFRFIRWWPWVLGVLLASLLNPAPALAIIPHWDPREAFFIRQFSYLFFMLAMLYFIYELKLGKLPQQRGFRLLVWASAFFALWNLDGFLGQLFALFYQPQVVEGTSGILGQRLGMTGFGHWVTYFTKLDHLLLVPAFVFFYLGLKAFRRGQEAGEL